MDAASGSSGRRSILRCALAGAVLLLIGACTPPGLPDPITPTGLTSVPTSPPAAGTVVIGLDGRAGRLTGFNPYAIADFSPAAQAAASLVLPSTFVVAADGSLTADPDVIDSAEVTTQDPFTVTYTVDRKASWSDGTPVAAEDFSYLREQLLTAPGTVDPAGYRLISDIRSRDAGKTVEVEFSEPFPDWRTLFSPLLPSHLVKDFPGGWGAAFNADIPVSANKYRMNSYDPITGQISLSRNDKYWGTPPQPATVILRLGDQSDLLAAFSRGDVQALWFAPTAGVATALDAAVPADLRTVIPIPATVQLVFNTTTGATSNPSLRAAIGAGIDLTEVTAELTGDWPQGGAAVTSQVHLPSDPRVIDPGQIDQGERPVATDDQAAAEALALAGYTQGGLYASDNGVILRLTLGYPNGDARLAAAARDIQRQLGEIGIEIDLLPDAAPNLVETRIASGTMDLALLPIPRGSSDPVAAASDFGCPAGDVLGIGSTVTTETSATTPAADGTDAEFPDGADAPTTGETTVATPDGNPTSTTDGRPTGEAAAQDETAAPRTGNLSGYCQASTQRELVDAITGNGEVAAADPALWSDLPVLPLIQPAAVFAVSESLRSVMATEHRGWMWAGPLSGLPTWPVS